jgi:DNA-binding CsgD family transcriptional regulator
MDAETLRDALDNLPEGLIVWQPAGGELVFANRAARAAALLLENGAVAADLASCAAEQRDSRKQLARHGCDSPAHRLQRGDRVWWVRTAALARGRELVICRREQVRERELVDRMRSVYSLTDRQADVLRHVLRGSKNVEIARALRLAYATVRRHLSDLQSALGARNRIEVYRTAERFRDPSSGSSRPSIVEGRR